MAMGLVVLNVLFAVFVLVVIPGPLIWAIRTASHDHRTVASSEVLAVPQAELIVEEPELSEVALA